MESIVEEVRLWNTPLVGAFLLWKFTQGYTENHADGDSPIGLLHFIALPILSSKKLASMVSDRRDDLQSFIRGFEDKKQTDLLLALQDKIYERKGQTLKSIDVAVHTGLLTWDVESGKIFARNVNKTIERQYRLRPVHEQEGKKAYILGKWFSKHDLNSILSYFKLIL
jgi:hypothetical protein